MDTSSEHILVFSSQDMKAITNNLNKNNLVGHTLFGRIFRGQVGAGLIGKEALPVTVKIWDENFSTIASNYDGDENLLLKEEVNFLVNPAVNDGHPNLVKLIGFCREKELKGVVYDLDALDTLQNIMLKDDLNWNQRLSVIYELAKLLKFLHDQGKQQLVLNISASHILLDKDYRPKVADFLLLSKIKTLNEYIPSFASYVDPYFSFRGGEWNRSSEVFSFGVVLLQLITKRTSYTAENGNLVLDSMVQNWVKREYKPNCSLVHSSLQQGWDYHVEDGIAVTALGMECVGFFPMNRPLMVDIVQRLEDLHVSKRLGDKRPAKRGRKGTSYLGEVSFNSPSTFDQM